MTISLKKICLIGAAGLTLGGCGYPPFDATPEPQVQSLAVEVPTVEEEEVQPKRTWSTGHVPSGNSNVNDRDPSDSDEDGGWG